MSLGDLVEVEATTLDIPHEGPIGDLLSLTASVPAALGELTSLVASTPTPPTANAGDDQSGLEPFQTVTLAGSSPDSPDAWSWRQISGPTVTLAGANTATPTYEAPCTLNGGTVVLGLTVTKDGVTSVEDTVTHTALYATEVINIAGALTPYVPYVCIDDGN